MAQAEETVGLMVCRVPGNACPVGWLYPTGEPPGQCWFRTQVESEQLLVPLFPPNNCHSHQGCWECSSLS